MNCKTCAGPCIFKGRDIEGDCEGYKPYTNYERIRAMSIEELADGIFDVMRGWCPNQASGCTTVCKECLVAWLRKEATE